MLGALGVLGVLGGLGDKFRGFYLAIQKICCTFAADL